MRRKAMLRNGCEVHCVGIAVNSQAVEMRRGIAWLRSDERRKGVEERSSEQNGKGDDMKRTESQRRCEARQSKVTA